MPIKRDGWLHNYVHTGVMGSCDISKVIWFIRIMLSHQCATTDRKIIGGKIFDREILMNCWKFVKFVIFLCKLKYAAI